ncbi:MAG: dihydroorotate dehydrogenase [Clostridia bacterium]
MNNLKVSVCGVPFKNPIIAASGTFGYGKEYEKFFDLSELGGISVKGMTLLEKAGNPSPRIAETTGGIINAVGLQNPGVEAFLHNELPRLKTKNTVIIANVAGSTVDEYLRIVERVSASDVDMIEVNISCPNVKEGGMAFGTLPQNVEALTRQIKARSSKPIIMKLTPNVTNIADNAKAVENGGGDAVSLINTLSGMAVNYKTRRPILANNIGGLSGACVKPIALKMVWQCYNAVKIPIIGLGGISSFTDVLEFMICGASAVQVGSATLLNPTACYDIAKDLQNYVEENNIDINSLVGSLQLN